MARVRGHDVERAVGADAGRLDHVERDRPARPAPRRSASCPKYFCASTSRLWSARGTTVPMMTRVTSALAKPSSASNWCSHTAYSSAVRRGSVAMRQRARISPPSATSAKTTLVFPASIASNMARALDRSGQLRASPEVTSPARMTSTLPPASRSRSAPSGSIPSNVPGDALAGAAVDVERRAERVGARQPRLREGRRVGRSPRREQPREAGREQGREGLRGDRCRRARRSCARRSAGAAARLTPKPATTRSPERSSRMPASLAPPSSRSLGHLSISAGPGAATSTASISARPAASDKRRRGRIAGAQLDQRSSRRNCRRAIPRRGPGGPRPASWRSATSQSPSTARGSASRALLVEPIRSTMRMRLRTSDPAALSVSVPSGPMSR